MPKIYAIRADGMPKQRQSKQRKMGEGVEAAKATASERLWQSEKQFQIFSLPACRNFYVFLITANAFSCHAVQMPSKKVSRLRRGMLASTLRCSELTLAKYLHVASCIYRVFDSRACSWSKRLIALCFFIAASSCCCVIVRKKQATQWVMLSAK